MNFTTVSGSKYELDKANSRLRRLSGNHLPTFNQPKDKKWRSFLEISEVAVDQPVIILWCVEEETVPVLRRTMLSVVESIDTENV